MIIAIGGASGRCIWSGKRARGQKIIGFAQFYLLAISGSTPGYSGEAKNMLIFLLFFR
jgi:hypothetical protein